MKIKNIISGIALLLLTAMLQSCLKNQEDAFDTPASLRVQQALDNTQKVLMSSADGWVLDYYPDRNQIYGGYVYTLQFNNLEVTAGMELSQGEYEMTKYKMSDECGPVLAFDTYNSLLHYFSTPSFSNYEAMDGDFEFIIDKTSDDLIQLRGIRTNNVMYMHRLTVSPDEYIAGVLNMQSNMKCGGFEGDTGKRHIKGYFDYDNRQFTYSLSGDTTATDVKTAFVFTNEGVRFYQPIPMEGGSVYELKHDLATWAFSGKNSAGNEVAFQGLYPKGYVAYDSMIGNWTLETENMGNIDVSLEDDGTHEGYVMKGLGDKLNMKLRYDKDQGCLYWNSQQVGIAEDGNEIWSFAMDEDYYISTSSRTCMKTETLSDENPISLHWISGDGFDYSEFFTYVGFRIWEYDRTADNISHVTNNGYLFANSYEYIILKKMTKK